MPGEFHWLHQVSVDSKGNIYTAEVDTGSAFRNSFATVQQAAAEPDRQRLADL